MTKLFVNQNPITSYDTEENSVIIEGTKYIYNPNTGLEWTEESAEEFINTNLTRFEVVPVTPLIELTAIVKSVTGTDVVFNSLADKFLTYASKNVSLTFEAEIHDHEGNIATFINHTFYLPIDGPGGEGVKVVKANFVEGKATVVTSFNEGEYRITEKGMNKRVSDLGIKLNSKLIEFVIAE